MTVSVIFLKMEEDLVLFQGRLTSVYTIETLLYRLYVAL